MNDNQHNLNQFIYKTDKPCIFKNLIKQIDENEVNNSVCKWTPEYLTCLFKNTTLTFRIGKKKLLDRGRFEFALPNHYAASNGFNNN